MRNRIRELRELARISQTELARNVRVSRQAIHAIESDRHDPSVRLALRIARELGKTIEEVFDVESIDDD
ncbi:MAG TPA: helix-turn-helix transcriptional regulator [Thermoanaerobaculia bacterium]|nr:helix-turn-helix transcriptional regulator [Thermoanaerobaculia bacterium]